MLRLIRRIILIPIAFILAVLASVSVFAILGYEYVADATAISTQDPEVFIEEWWNLAGEAKTMAAYLTGATIIPAILLIIVGESASIRSSVYYIVGAGLSLAAMPVLYDLSTTSELSQTAQDALPMFATAGFAGGLVYWLIAGRTA